LQKIDLEEIYFRFTNLYKDRPYLSLWRSCEALSILNCLKEFERLSDLNTKSGFNLDIGCGDGRTAKGLDLNFSVGLDTDLISVREAKDIGQYEYVIVGDATHLPVKPWSVNFALSNCVFEHIESIEDAINDLSNSLCKSSLFIITMPTKNLLSDILFLMPLSLFGIYNNSEVHINRSLRHYHYFDNNVLRMFNRVGFRFVSSSYYMPSKLVSWWLFLRYSERLFQRLNLIYLWRIISCIVERINYSLIKGSLKCKKAGGGITIALMKNGG